MEDYYWWTDTMRTVSWTKALQLLNTRKEHRSVVTQAWRTRSDGGRTPVAMIYSFMMPGYDDVVLKIKPLYTVAPYSKSPWIRMSCSGVGVKKKDVQAALVAAIMAGGGGAP